VAGAMADGTRRTRPDRAVRLRNPPVGLRQVVTVCGNGYDCKSRPVIQADVNDEYQLDYSTDGSSWTRYGVFPAVSGGGLQTRAADPDAGNVAGNNWWMTISPSRAPAARDQIGIRGRIPLIP
jgi:hypothetical protein